MMWSAEESCCQGGDDSSGDELVFAAVAADGRCKLVWRDNAVLALSAGGEAFELAEPAPALPPRSHEEDTAAQHDRHLTPVAGAAAAAEQQHKRPAAPPPLRQRSEFALRRAAPRLVAALRLRNLHADVPAYCRPLLRAASAAAAEAASATAAGSDAAAGAAADDAAADEDGDTGTGAPFALGYEVTEVYWPASASEAAAEGLVEARAGGRVAVRSTCGAARVVLDAAHRLRFAVCYALSLRRCGDDSSVGGAHGIGSSGGGTGGGGSSGGSGVRRLHVWQTSVFSTRRCPPRWAPALAVAEAAADAIFLGSGSGRVLSAAEAIMQLPRVIWPDYDAASSCGGGRGGGGGAAAAALAACAPAGGGGAGGGSWWLEPSQLLPAGVAIETVWTPAATYALLHVSLVLSFPPCRREGEGEGRAAEHARLHGANNTAPKAPCAVPARHARPLSPNPSIPGARRGRGLAA